MSANNQATIEKRLIKMKEFYAQLDKTLDEIPDVLPKDIKTLIRDKILGDKELKELIDGIENHRPPRFLLIGRTGVGKSSLINALSSGYIAAVSDVESCTTETKIYPCYDGDRKMMDIMDSRGISESISTDERVTAEDQLLNGINEFKPDVVLFLLAATHRDNIDKDVEFLKRIKQKYAEVNKVEVPVLVVINKADEVQPSRIKDPAEYNVAKKENLQSTVIYYQKICEENGLVTDGIVDVSSYIEWADAAGNSVQPSDILEMSQSEINGLQIEFDGRYHIDELREKLEEAIRDFDAKMGFRMALQLNELVRKMATHLTNSFVAIASAIAFANIPVADIYILLVVQSIMVALIAGLSGRDISIDTGKEFLASLFLTGGAGAVFRIIAHSAVKFIPVAGGFINSGIAGAGTKAIGTAAIKYYIDGVSIEEAREIFKKENKAKND
ncbi:MAG: 50S ribosome-binding GTPase [Butyrivibrio sp.]|nr:50S ribosome-binding GTPase [Butyrivibrio sp.]